MTQAATSLTRTAQSTELLEGLGSPTSAGPGSWNFLYCATARPGFASLPRRTRYAIRVTQLLECLTAVLAIAFIVLLLQDPSFRKMLGK